jgi:PAS domain S-box-containing protein
MISLLYVDDEPDLLEIGRLFLENTGDFSVTTSPSGRTGLETLAQHDFDAIVSDYLMPGMDGIAFLKSVRTSFGNIPFILFTGRGREDVVIEAINNGVDFYLQKGGDPTVQFVELAHKIRQAVSRRRAETALRKSEEKFRDIVETSPDMIWDTDTDGVFTYMSPQCTDLTGYTPQEVIGKPIFDFVPDAALPQFREIFSESARTKKTHKGIDLHVRCKDGHVIIMDVHAVIQNDSNGRFAGFRGISRDITEKRKAVEVLNESERRFRELADLLPQGVYEAGTDGRLIYVNRIGLEMTGYTSEDIRNGVNALNVITSGDRPRAAMVFRRMVEKGDRSQGNAEYLAQRKDGSTFPVSIFSSPIFRDGRIIGVRGVIMDISKQKKADEELRSEHDELGKSEERIRESEVNYRELANLLPQIVFELDLGLRLTFANQIALKIFGLNEEGLRSGVNALRLIDPSQHERVKENIERIIRGKQVENNEYTAIRADGTTFPVIIYSAPIFRHGHPAGFRGIGLDITERKRTEAALRESESRFRTIFDTSPAGIIVVDVQTHQIADANSKALAMIGASKDDVIGSVCHRFICPAEAGRCPVTDLGEEVNTSERVLLTCDRKALPVLKTVISAVIGGRDVLIESFIDISEQKRSEAGIREANRKLNLLNSITRHDIRNQLTLAQGYTDLATLCKPDPVVLDHLSRISAAIQTIQHQIDFTKAYQELGVHAPAWFSVSEVIGRVRPETIAVRMSCDAVEIFADPMIDKVFFNLFENAAKYGELVTTVTVRCEERGDRLVITFADNGVGIPVEEKQKIFEKGYGKNTGLGLFLVREILMITGITISETGTCGMGAVFEINVPKGAFRSTE